MARTCSIPILSLQHSLLCSHASHTDRHSHTHGRPHRDVAVMAHLLPLPLLCLLDPSGYASAHSWTCLFSAALSGLCFSVLFLCFFLSLLAFPWFVFFPHLSSPHLLLFEHCVLFCSMLSGQWGLLGRCPATTASTIRRHILFNA